MLVGAKVRVFLKLTNDFCFFRFMGGGEDGRGWERMGRIREEGNDRGGSGARRTTSSL